MRAQKLISARRMRECDLKTLLSWRNHSDVRRYMLSQHEISMSEHLAWFKCSQNDDTRALLVIEEDNRTIGCVVFSNVSFRGAADWSFYADPDGAPGTGRKVCAAALDIAFNELEVHKVIGQVIEFNEASIRTHLRLGFTQEGILREHHFINGKYLNLVIFGLLSNEWLDVESRMIIGPLNE